MDGHKSSEAWKKGFEGNGVIVGVIDDGIDFAHPDLQGTTARVTDPDSPYYGWPMAFSQASTQYFAYDVFGDELHCDRCIFVPLVVDGYHAHRPDVAMAPHQGAL